MGVYAAIKLSNKFILQPELLYSNKGYRMRADADRGSKASRADFYYIVLPIMVIFRLIDKVGIELARNWVI